MTSPASTRKTLSTLLIGICALSAAACGTANNGEENTAAAAISQSLTNVSTKDFKLTTEQAGCIGTATVKAFGVKKAISYGLLTNDLKPVTAITWALSSTDADTFATTFITCADPMATLKTGLMQVIKPSAADKEQAVQACLDKNLTSSVEQKVLATAFTGNNTDSPLASVFTTCRPLG